ncbi:hypothetical protein ACFL1L_01175 [Thermoplasmatota archaeon]
MVKMNRNPYKICTLDQNSNCIKCKNNYKIHCKINIKHTILSMFVIGLFLTVSIIGLFYIGIITGIWWMLIAFIIFIFLFFIIIEPRITCSHCPYYAEKRFRFNCTGNMITPKIWKYHPEPINKYEKAVTFIGFVFLGGFPLSSELFGIWFLYSNGFNILNQSFLGLVFIFISTIIICLIFFVLFLLIYCPRCINFSCFFNKVSKSIVDEYLRKNPVMRKAWEKEGYKFNINR